MIRELTIDRLINVFVKKLYVIVAITVLFALSAFIYSAYFVEYKYTSSGTMIVINSKTESGEISKTDLDASARLVDTYRIILTSTRFCERVAKDLDVKCTAKEVKKALVLSGINNTEILSVKATTTDKNLSQKIVQGVLKNAEKELKEISKAYRVTQLDSASVPGGHSSPNIKFNTVLGTLLGLLFSIAFVLLSAMFDTKIKDEQELKERYNIPSLGAIPNINGGKK